MTPDRRRNRAKQFRTHPNRRKIDSLAARRKILTIPVGDLSGGRRNAIKICHRIGGEEKNRAPSAPSCFTQQLPKPTAVTQLLFRLPEHPTPPGVINEEIHFLPSLLNIYARGDLLDFSSRQDP